MLDEIILKAKKGYVYTNGEIFVKTVELPNNSTVKTWHQITEEEANIIQKEMEQEI